MKYSNETVMKRQKTGGRQAGTVNKTTKEMRAYITGLVSGIDIQQDLKQLEPARRLEIVLRLLPYLLPKYKEESAPVDLSDWTGGL